MRQIDFRGGESVGPGYRNLFPKPRHLKNGFSPFVDAKRVAIEDQLIIATDTIAIKKWHAMPGGQLADHLSSKRRFADMKGRRTQVKNKTCPFSDQTRN